jgi:Fe2+ or Zn2+ uptake regulation protein
VSSSLTELLQSLANRGERLTRTRRAVLEALAAADGPVSVRALHESVGARRVDLVTVYRTLHWLAELGVARAVLTGGAAELFELVYPNQHTHHLLCDECGAVLTVGLCGVDPTVAERIEREHGFAVSHHRLTYHGRCRECAARGG